MRIIFVWRPGVSEFREAFWFLVPYMPLANSCEREALPDLTGYSRSTDYAPLPDASSSAAKDEL